MRGSIFISAFHLCSVGPCVADLSEKLKESPYSRIYMQVHTFMYITRYIEVYIGSYVDLGGRLSMEAKSKEQRGLTGVYIVRWKGFPESVRKEGG